MGDGWEVSVAIKGTMKEVWGERSVLNFAVSKYIVMFCWSFVRRWGKLGKGSIETLLVLTTECGSEIISWLRH